VKALSIKQPWAWLIANGFKDIENRNWRHTPKLRGRFLIHAGQRMDEEMGELLRRYVIGANVMSLTGFARVDSSTLSRLLKEYPGSSSLPVGGIVGEAEIVDVVRQSGSPWFFGPLGFVLKNARPLPFMPCRGQLGFFDVDYRLQAMTDPKIFQLRRHTETRNRIRVSADGRNRRLLVPEEAYRGQRRRHLHHP